MKQLYVFLLACFIGFAGYSQKEKKPKINKANSLREKGELVEAKSIIDAATQHEKTKDDGKTYYYRGLIYATIDTTSNAEHAALSDNALTIAMESFNKAKEMGEASSYYVNNDIGLPILLAQQIDGYYSYYYNIGVTGFSDGEYEKAVSGFENSYLIFPTDTNAYINAAYAAHNGELYDAAKKNYQAAIDNGAVSKDLFYNYINILTSIDNDNETALEVVRSGREIYPTDATLAKNEINMLIQLDRIDDAKTNLEKAIEAEPDNPNLYFTLASMYEQLDDEEAALNAYRNALKVDPNHFESNFNMGVIMIDRASAVIKKRNDLGVSKADLKKAAAMEPVINQKLKEALPQWEKVYEVRPTEKSAIETLRYIYSMLKMNKKADEMQDALDALE
ncbi:MAG: tetratricopeptide repeat protein [Cyclobacteriaceae bacterium]